MAQQSIRINETEILDVSDNNYTNTIIQSLIGPMGPMGPAGPAGLPGPRGPRGRSSPYNTFVGTSGIVVTLQPSGIVVIASSGLGTDTNYATLTNNGTIPTSQLPNSVFNVVEYNNISNFPAVGETNKLYIDRNTNILYRWNNTQYTGLTLSVENIDSALEASYAPLNNAALLGSPTVPTAPLGSDSNQIANTAFVKREVNNLNNLVPKLSEPNIFSNTLTAPTGSFQVLTQNNTPVSISGHKHSTSDIDNFDSSVSGLLPVRDILAAGGRGANYVNVSKLNNIYTINVTGVQPLGDYALTNHTHQVTAINNFDSSVSGLLPITSISGGSNISITQTGKNYTISVVGLSGASLSGMGGIDVSYLAPLDTIIISSSGLSLVGHKHLFEEIDILSDVSMQSFKITNLATPISSGDAVNKNYIDTLYASNFLRGIASFSSSYFDVTNGSVSLKTSQTGLDLDGGSP